jgi:hypothetical protein
MARRKDRLKRCQAKTANALKAKFEAGAPKDPVVHVVNSLDYTVPPSDFEFVDDFTVP